ncbi:hypothetical protein [Microcoleus sp. FACHB-831]|nr:hypothetical protein [Microcoleus sp. FACHB-831]
MDFRFGILVKGLSQITAIWVYLDASVGKKNVGDRLGFNPPDTHNLKSQI